MTEADETFVKSALQELAQHLNEDPIKLRISIKRLGNEAELAKEIDRELNRLNDPSYKFSDSATQIVNIFVRVLYVPQSFVVPRLLVYCHKDSQVAKAAQKKAPWACWGATCGSLSAVYESHNKVTIWHEVVHLLLRRTDNLDECYEPYHPYAKKADCNCDTCIMQYAAPENTCENWPFLCDKNVELLQELTEEV